jgi:hypothetical protein
MIMKVKIKCVFCLVIFFFLSSFTIFSQEIPELLVYIRGDTIANIIKENNKPPHLIKLPKDIKTELKKRYNEVWAADKSKWPECIRKVFENLKKNEIIFIRWELDPRLRNSYYQGDYDANGKLVTDCTMKIINVYANKFHESDYAIAKAKLDKTRINPNMWFKTSGILLHEMLHMALLRNQSTKEVRNDKGEVVDSYEYEPKVEDCTSLVFKDGIRFYDLQGLNAEKDKPDDCNCENQKGQFKSKGIVCGLMGSPGNDHADENAAFSSENISQFSIDSNALVYMNGYFEEMNTLSGGVL